MPDVLELGEQWDFYPTLIEDTPASISLNLALEEYAPIDGADTLYWVQIQMRDPDEHGLGSPEESAALNPIEDAIVEQAVGLIYAGRVRNRGIWHLAFYGRPEHEALLRATEISDREHRVVAIPNADWDYYLTFLVPDRERRQWMGNRSVVASLESNGDPLTAARRVDHWSYFETAAGRDAFIEAAKRERFEVEDRADEESIGAHLHRVDRVDLASIHEVVMILVELADQHGGEYDGWETSIEKGE